VYTSQGYAGKLLMFYCQYVIRDPKIKCLSGARSAGAAVTAKWPSQSCDEQDKVARQRPQGPDAPAPDLAGLVMVLIAGLLEYFGVASLTKLCYVDAVYRQVVR
jgi:hypothetical protein